MSAISSRRLVSPAATSLTTTGTLCRPASCAARQRRSPAMIWKRGAPLAPGSMRRATIGWMMPLALIDRASSSSASASIARRG